MKRLFFVMFLVLIATFASCARQEVPKEDTEQFVNDFKAINTGLITDTENSQAFRALSSMPGGAIIKFENNVLKTLKLDKLGIPSKFLYVTKGVGDYGTYEWKGIDSGWVLTDSTYPTNGYLFKWSFIDTIIDETLSAELLYDSLQTQIVNNDTLPKKFHMHLKVGTTSLLNANFSGNWIAVGDGDVVPNNLNAVITFYTIAQYGITLTNVTYIINDKGDIEPTSGTLRLWVIDYQNNNYRIDYTVVLTSQTKATFTAEDSNKWKIWVEATAVRGDTTIVTLDGEITYNKKHAADIDGKIYEPDNEDNPKSYVDVIYPDGTKERVFPEAR